MYGKDADRFAQLVMDAAGLKDGPVFEYGFEKGKEQKEVQPELTRLAWLRDIPNGKDRMTQAETPVLSKSFGNKSAAHRKDSNKPDTDIVGHDQKAAPIVELRRMAGSAPVANGRPLR